MRAFKIIVLIMVLAVGWFVLVPLVKVLYFKLMVDRALSTQGTPTEWNGLYFSSRPSFSPDGRFLLFSAYRRGDSDIYVMRVDGTGLKRLTQNGAINYEPGFSPDGRTIVFVVGKDRLSGRLYRMEADGSNQQPLTYNSAAELSPSFAPDGTKIVFARAALPVTTGDIGPIGAEWDLHVLTLDGSTEFPITHERYPLASACSFSPDGKKVVFSVANELFEVGVYVVDADGSRPPTRLLGQIASYPAFSPNGKKLVCVTSGMQDGKPWDALLVMGPDGFNPVELLRKNEDLTSPVFSPDSQSLLFLRAQKGSDVNTLWQMDVNGEHLRRVKIPL